MIQLFYKDYLGKKLEYISIYRPHIRGTRGGVSSNNPYVAQAALEILKQGGNAADAAQDCIKNRCAPCDGFQSEGQLFGADCHKDDLDGGQKVDPEVQLERGD